MKFHSSGPDIPDQLLWLRDEGSVVFVCGAGVSLASAGMPDFPSLAGMVLDDLIVPEDAKARRVLNLSLKPENDGLVPVDKVFSELEREYPISEIERSVARILSPPYNTDTYCHEVIRDLATTPAGVLRLITTNFDDLFSRVIDAREYVGPDLPQLGNQEGFGGLVYLHGKCDAEPRFDRGRFVLSTRSFGQAYMAEGWACEFLKSVMEKYTVVFVGYSADDPPMQYLLEALAQSDPGQRNVFAFQQGDKDTADSKWAPRGVQAIAFDQYDDLWRTLELWRQRAQDQVGWIGKILDMADSGPFDLENWQRSQVAHLAAHIVGATAIAERRNPIPSSWLFCFDSVFRFATPKRVYDPHDQTRYPDPFAILGLTEDHSPKPIGVDDPYANRDTPPDAWDAFSINEQDKKEAHDKRHFATFRGHGALMSSELSPRLQRLAVWIGKVASNPSTVRWAAHQSGLHPAIQGLIRWGLDRNSEDIPNLIVDAWDLLFEIWEEVDTYERRDVYRLDHSVKQHGWSSARIRQFQRITKPVISVRSPYTVEIILKGDDEPESISDLVDWEVKVPDNHIDITVPDELLPKLLKAQRQNLEVGIDLEKLSGHYGLFALPPIFAADDPTISSYDRTHGVNGLAFSYLATFRKIMDCDLAAAKREIGLWDLDDIDIFSRFRIWAASETELTSPTESGQIFRNLPDRVFWGSRHQRDLLHSLKKRWSSLPITATRSIEKRIVAGAYRWPDEPIEKYSERKARLSANMLQWLHEQGCSLNLNFNSVMENLRKNTPTWKPEYSLKADESLESRGGTVGTDTTHDMLVGIPIGDILEIAKSITGRERDFLTEDDPFKGLCQNHPVRALAALRNAARSGEYTEWAWSRWLQRETSGSWPIRQLIITAVLICTMSDEDIEGLKYSVFRWFDNRAKDFPTEFYALRDNIFYRLLNALRSRELNMTSAIVRQKHRDIDWVTEMLNSPAGELTDALFETTELDNINDVSDIPPKWLTKATTLFDLNGDSRRFVLIAMMRRVRWLEYWLPEWTDTHLHNMLRAGDALDQEAYWAGFAFGMRGLPSPEFFQRVKPELLSACTSQTFAKRSHAQNLISLVLGGWLNRIEDCEARWVTDPEFAQVLSGTNDELRCHVLWQIKRWSSDEDSEAQFDWLAAIQIFLRNVWPKTLAANTNTTSMHLIELALSNVEWLPKLAPMIIPRLVSVGQHGSIFWKIRRGESDVVNKHPEIVLEILHKVLANDPDQWPRDISATFDQISQAKPSLAEDRRLLELRRRQSRR